MKMKINQKEGGRMMAAGRHSYRSGMTLIELTIVISVLLILIGLSVYGIAGYQRWKLGAEAGTELRMVRSAQRTYLAEHPTESVDGLTAAKIIPYLSSGASALPTVEDLDGNQLTIKVDVMPPVVDDGTGEAYDPSSSTSDGQWDVGD